MVGSLPLCTAPLGLISSPVPVLTEHTLELDNNIEQSAPQVFAHVFCLTSQGIDNKFALTETFFFSYICGTSFRKGSCRGGHRIAGKSISI